MLHLVDPKLKAQLRPHQAVGVEFLLKRLLSDQLKFNSKPVLFQTGAILADDMGTGKVN